MELHSLNHVNTSLFTPSSPDYPNLGQLDGQQCNSAKVHPYAYPQHMNMLKHFLYIQYGCGQEVSCIVAPTMSTCHYFTPPSPDYPNLGQLVHQHCNSARVHPYAYPHHMKLLKHFVYIQYGYGEGVNGIVQHQPCLHIIISPQHPKNAIIQVNMASSETV